MIKKLFSSKIIYLRPFYQFSKEEPKFLFGGSRKGPPRPD